MQISAFVKNSVKTSSLSLPLEKLSIPFPRRLLVVEAMLNVDLPDQAGSNWIKMDQTGPEWIKLD